MERKVYEFISKQTNDPIIERKTCKFSGEPFAIFQSDLDFYEKISPTFNGKKCQIPTPNFCPDCREQRRISFRNESKLYKRKCDKTGKDIISVYAPGTYVAYHLEQWFGDDRDGTQYGTAYDFSKNFFQQFKELFVKVPKRALTNGKGSENSEYTNAAGTCKNCYLIFNSAHDEECYYGNLLIHCKNCIDNFGIQNSEILYECVDCVNCYKSFYLQNCEDCKDSSFLKDCKNCDRCFGCVNLCNKQNHIFNTPYYTKEAYEKKLSEILQTGFSSEAFQEFSKKFPVIHVKNSNVENCIGDNIYNSKDAINCFEAHNVNNIKFGYIVDNDNDCMDISSVNGYASGGCTKVYESGFIFEQSHNILFSFACRNTCNNLIYCIECRLCKDCFGCTGLRNKQYCILNKQYTQEEYETLVPQLIEKMQADGERGELFPSSLSPFGYNETVAQEYFPLTKDEALAKGFKWSDYEAPFPKGDGRDVVICEVSKKPFRLIPQEIEFYTKHNLPLPTKHPDVRHAERMKLRNPRKLFDRTCAKCGIDIKTTYAPERPEIVYCETCYNKEIYG